MSNDTSKEFRAKLYPASQINHNGLCPEHHDEFDQDPEEAKDWEDYIENRLNNL